MPSKKAAGSMSVRKNPDRAARPPSRASQGEGAPSEAAEVRQLGLGPIGEEELPSTPVRGRDAEAENRLQGGSQGTHQTTLSPFLVRGLPHIPQPNHPPQPRLHIMPQPFPTYAFTPRPPPLGREDITAALEREPRALREDMNDFVHRLYGLLVNASLGNLPDIGKVISLAQSVDRKVDHNCAKVRKVVKADLIAHMGNCMLELMDSVNEDQTYFCSLVFSGVHKLRLPHHLVPNATGRQAPGPRDQLRAAISEIAGNAVNIKQIRSLGRLSLPGRPPAGLQVTFMSVDQKRLFLSLLSQHQKQRPADHLFKGV